MTPITLTLGATLTIRPWSAARAALPTHARQAIQADLEVPNPAYAEAKRLGRWTGGIPRTLRLWHHDRSTDTLTVPAGYLSRLWAVLKPREDRLRVELVDTRAERPVAWPPARMTLRDDQAQAVDALVQAARGDGFGLLVAPPGSGKTVMGLEAARCLGQRTLWLTHTRDLADQARTRAAEHFGLDGENVGLLGDGERRIGRVLTVGLIPTLARMGDSEFPATMFGAVVLDEAHHTPAGTWAATLGRLTARYRFGLTATPTRADGLHAITFLFLGPVTHEIQTADTPGAGALVPRLHIVRTSTVPPTWAKYEARTRDMARDRRPPVPYGDILTELLADESRNLLITGLLARIAPGHHTLVLSARVEHCKHLAAALAARAPVLRVAVVHGEQPAGERRGIIDEARAGRMDVLFSVNVAKEGLDVPCLDQLVLVAGGRDPIYLRQAVGRLLRPAPGKREIRVWDIVDEAVVVLRAQYWARRKVYRELGMVQPRRQSAAA